MVLIVDKEVTQVGLDQVVKVCLKKLQAQAKLGRQDERPGNAIRGRCRCWCCGEEGHVLRQCPTVKRNRVAQNEATRPRKSKNQKVQGGARRCQKVPDGVRGCQAVPDGARECQILPEGARQCQMVPDGVKGCQRVPDGARECQMVPEGPDWDGRGPSIR